MIKKNQSLQTLIVSLSLVGPSTLAVSQEPTLIGLAETISSNAVPQNALQPSATFEPMWVWSKNPSHTPVVLTQDFYLQSPPGLAELQIAVDDSFTAFINGNSIGVATTDWTKPHPFDVTSKLKTGKNTLRLECTNQGGEASAIAAIRLKIGDQVLLVGTGPGTLVEFSGSPVAARTLPASSAPWNLFKPEPAAAKLLRLEAKRLSTEVNDKDELTAARAIGYLAQLALDNPKLDLQEPTFTLIKPSRVQPNPISQPLLANAREMVVQNLTNVRSLQRGAAAAAISLLIAKSVNTKDLLTIVRYDFCTPGNSSSDIRLAVLIGLKRLVEADKEAFPKAAENVKKKQDAKQAEIVAKQVAVANLEKEISLVVSMIASFSKGLEGNNVPEVIEAVNNVILSLVEKLKRLSADLTERNNELSTLVTEFKAIQPSAVDSLAFARLDDIESFLLDIDNSDCLGKGIESSLAATVEKLVRELRRDYYSIKSFTKADAFFDSVASGGAVPIPVIGASTSAADRPIAGDSFTSGDRVGVSITAPFDPSVRPQNKSPYPLSDSASIRQTSDAPRIDDNVFRKAPGGTGGTKPK